MSNKTLVKVKDLDARSLLKDPNIVILDTKYKLLLNDINVNLDESLLSKLTQDTLADGVSILGSNQS